MASSARRGGPTKRRPKAEPAAAPEQQGDTRWWVIVAGIENDPMRYGPWRNKPTKSYSDSIEGNDRFCQIAGDDDEPELVVVLHDTLLFTIANTAHIEARPQFSEGDSST